MDCTQRENHGPLGVQIQSRLFQFDSVGVLGESVVPIAVRRASNDVPYYLYKKYSSWLYPALTAVAEIARIHQRSSSSYTPIMTPGSKPFLMHRSEEGLASRLFFADELIAKAPFRSLKLVGITIVILAGW